MTLFHCKSCAFIRSKPHYCQTHWFQKFFVGWLIRLGRGPLSLQELLLSFGQSRAIAKSTGFRGFLWVGSSCWEEGTPFHCRSCAFIRSKPRYCQKYWLQVFFVDWLTMLGPRWDKLLVATSPSNAATAFQYHNTELHNFHQDANRGHFGERGGRRSPTFVPTGCEDHKCLQQRISVSTSSTGVRTRVQHDPV